MASHSSLAKDIVSECDLHLANAYTPYDATHNVITDKDARAVAQRHSCKSIAVSLEGQLGVLVLQPGVVTARVTTDGRLSRSNGTSHTRAPIILKGSFANYAWVH